MPALTLSQSIARAKSRAEKAKAEVQARWQDTVAEARLLYPKAKEWLDQQSLTPRQTWLLFAVVEDAEKNAQAGIRRSAKGWAFDGIAPRSRPNAYGFLTDGVKGFCSKQVKGDFTQLVFHSRNGYIWPEALGVAMVLYLRELFPVLMPDNDLDYAQPLLVGSVSTLPNLKWRRWRYEDIVTHECI